MSNIKTHIEEKCTNNNALSKHIMELPKVLFIKTLIDRECNTLEKTIKEAIGSGVKAKHLQPIQEEIDVIKKRGQEIMNWMEELIKREVNENF